MAAAASEAAEVAKETTASAWFKTAPVTNEKAPTLVATDRQQMPSPPDVTITPPEEENHGWLVPSKFDGVRRRTSSTGRQLHQRLQSLVGRVKEWLLRRGGRGSERQQQQQEEEKPPDQGVEDRHDDDVKSRE